MRACVPGWRSRSGFCAGVSLGGRSNRSKMARQYVSKTCRGCGAAYEASSKSPGRQFCSSACASAHQPRPKRLKRKICPGCRSEFEPKWHGAVACSRDCAILHRDAHWTFRGRRVNKSDLAAVAGVSVSVIATRMAAASVRHGEEVPPSVVEPSHQVASSGSADRVCRACGKQFRVRRPSDPAAFCSLACAGDYNAAGRRNVYQLAGAPVTSDDLAKVLSMRAGSVGRLLRRSGIAPGSDCGPAIRAAKAR
jgi:endogenous inhibitor of DNA gyrase (YacG/DUF329 family)